MMLSGNAPAIWARCLIFRHRPAGLAGGLAHCLARFLTGGIRWNIDKSKASISTIVI